MEQRLRVEEAVFLKNCKNECHKPTDQRTAILSAAASLPIMPKQLAHLQILLCDDAPVRLWPLIEMLGTRRRPYKKLMPVIRCTAIAGRLPQATGLTTISCSNTSRTHPRKKHSPGSRIRAALLDPHRYDLLDQVCQTLAKKESLLWC